MQPRVHVSQRATTTIVEAWQDGLRLWADAPSSAQVLFLTSDVVDAADQWDRLLLENAHLFDVVHAAEGASPSFLCAHRATHRGMVEFYARPFRFHSPVPRPSVAAFVGGGTLTSMQVARRALASENARRLPSAVPDWAAGLVLSAHLWNLRLRMGASATAWFVYDHAEAAPPPRLQYRPSDLLRFVAAFQERYLGVRDGAVGDLAAKGVPAAIGDATFELTFRFGHRDVVDNLELMEKYE